MKVRYSIHHSSIKHMINSQALPNFKTCGEWAIASHGRLLVPLVFFVHIDESAITFFNYFSKNYNNFILLFKFYYVLRHLMNFSDILYIILFKIFLGKLTPLIIFCLFKNPIYTNE